MSYDIIKSISIKNKTEVHVTSASSNVFPRTYYSGESKSLSIILQNEGRKALDRVLFQEFRNGNFQGESTDYAKALIWKKLSETECDDGELLTLFKASWKADEPAYATYDGYVIKSVGKRNIRYGYNSDPKYGKIFKNLTQAKFYLRHWNSIKFACFSDLPQTQGA